MGITDMVREGVSENKRWWMRVRNILSNRNEWRETKKEGSVFVVEYF